MYNLFDIEKRNNEVIFMSKEIEIEFKTLLTKEEYLNLCTKFADKRGNHQINY